MNPKSSIMSSSVNHNLAQLLAVGSMAIGVTATISAAPAQAVSLNAASIEFDGQSSSYYTSAKNGQSFSVSLNPFLPKQADVTAATGDLDSSFNTPGPYDINTPVLNFQWVSSNGSARVYKLTSPLNFIFTNGVKLSLAPGAMFSGSADNNGVTLGIDPNTLALFGIGSPDSPTTNFDFAFSDRKNGVNQGTYSIVARKDVPEPFSIIGTLIGGTAAFRLKKKLASSSKA